MKTTKKHFEIFKKEAEYWIQKFGLLDWNIYFSWGVEDGTNKAEVCSNASAMNATIYLTKNWTAEEPLCEKEIRENAFHEICHVLLAPMNNFRGNEDSDLARGYREGAVHGVIQRLLNTVWKQDYEAR